MPCKKKHSKWYYIHKAKKKVRDNHAYRVKWLSIKPKDYLMIAKTEQFGSKNFAKIVGSLGSMIYGAGYLYYPKITKEKKDRPQRAEERLMRKFKIRKRVLRNVAEWFLPY